MIYGYCRVSTTNQERIGNSLEVQEKAVKNAGATKIFKDSFTGTKSNRPGLNMLLNTITTGDTLIVTSIDRLGRSITHTSEVITNLIDKGVTVNVLNLGVLGSDSISTLLRNLLLSFAQFERDMIVQRTQEGKEIAKLNPNFKEGRPKKYNTEELDYAMSLLKTMTYGQVVELTGISRATLARYKKDTREQNGK